jgi:hypothetical protein
MLKAQMPVYLCSLAFIIATPTVANPGQPSLEPEKKVSRTVSKTRSTTSKKNKLVLSLPNKQGMKFVHVYIRNNDECLLTVKKRSEIPFSIIDSVFNRYGLPLELKYLAVIESELKASAVSRVGAQGPGQIMP